MLKHKPSPKNPIRKLLLKAARKRFTKDGLNNVNHTVIRKINFKLYTHYFIDVGEIPENLYRVTKKVIKVFKSVHKNQSLKTH